MTHWRLMTAACLAAWTALGADDSDRARREADALAADRSVPADDPALLAKLAALLRAAGLEGEAARAEARATEAAGDAVAPAANAGHSFVAGTGVGPDVTVSSLNGVGNYTSSGAVNGLLVFSVGTTSCNVGSAPVSWVQSTNQHPVIGQNMYRVWTAPGGSTRFEQVGLSWVKHSSCASQLALCAPCALPGFTCDPALMPGCSDPYFASLNGLQSELGPRSRINASTGAFEFPYPDPPAAAGPADRRLQVPRDEMDPAIYPGATFFIEGQYIAPDDSRAGNGFNNVTHRAVLFNWNATSRTVTFITPNGPDQRGLPAIHAWRALDPGVTLVSVDTTDEGVFDTGAVARGRMIVGYGVTPNGDGTWRYEYAVYNMNSSRGARAFSVPVPDTATISNVAFRSPAHHSGDGEGTTAANPTTFDNTPWVAVRAGGAITWSTARHEDNANANALRWGTSYNFRFDADAPPTTYSGARSGSITMYKPPVPAGGALQVSVDVAGPACLLAGDVDADGAVTFLDLNRVLSLFGAGYGMVELTQVLTNYGRRCF